MPLHIFEPRYRQMLSDCLEATSDSAWYRWTTTILSPAPAP